MAAEQAKLDEEKKALRAERDEYYKTLEPLPSKDDKDDDDKDGPPPPPKGEGGEGDTKSSGDGLQPA